MAFEHFETSGPASSLVEGPPIRISRAATPDDLLPLLWTRLKRGALVVATSGCNDTHAWLVLRQRERLPTLESTTPAEYALDAVLHGCSQKLIALERRVAFSTITTELKHSVSRMNLTGRISRVPLAVPLLAHVAARPGVLRAKVVGTPPCRPGEQCAIVLARVDEALRDSLSPSEFAVVRSLLEGRGYREIATERGASARTIANQICSIGRKLRARGRFDFLGAAVRRHRGPEESGTNTYASPLDALAITLY